MVENIIKSFDIWTEAQGVKSKGRVKSIDNISLEGIAHLRELILELAIRGKLVEQAQCDISVKELKKNIGIEKKTLIEKGKLKKGKPFSEIQGTNMRFELPNGWEWSWFPELYFFQEGPGIRNWQFRSKGIKLLNVQNIVGNTLVLENTDKFIDVEEYEQKYQHFTIEEGDLVFASSGGSWGKSAFFHNPGYKVIVNTSTIRIKPFTKKLSPLFLKYFLDSSFFKSQMVEQLVGMQPNFGSTHLNKIIVPTPSPCEQHRIAAKVDELMALCDKLEEEKTASLKTHQLLVKALLQTLTAARDADELDAAWQRLCPHFDTLFCTEDSIEQLKQTVLQLAIMGRLVKQDPKDEPAGELLKRIEKERGKMVKEGKLKRQKPLPEIGEEEKPFELPKGWEWVRLGHVGIGSTGKTPSTGNSKYFGGDIPFIGPGQVLQGGKITDPDKTLTELGTKESTLADSGDILMVCIGGSIGKCAIVSSRVAFNQQLNCIRPIIIDTKYLDVVLRSTYFQRLVLEKATGSATPIINRGKWEEIPVPVASGSEQQNIIIKVDVLMTLCEQLKTKMKKAEKVRLLLSKTIVENAVELVG